MNIMKKPIFLCITSFLLVSSIFAQDLEKRTLATSPFIGLKVFSGLKLRLIYSEVNKAVVFGPQSDDVIISMKNNVLQVKIALGSIPDSIPTTVDLYHSKLLNEISVSQGAKVYTDQPIRQTSLNLSTTSGGVADFEVYLERLDANATTGGRLELKGSATYLNLKVNTGGSCEAEQLKTDQLQAKLLAGGYAYVIVSQLLDAKVVGGSVLRVFGNPLKRIYQKKLGGKIHFEE
jgi:hypothetical protein